MQVTLDPFNWDRRKLTRFRTAREYFVWWKDEDGGTEIPGVMGLDCSKLGWRSDSAIEYFTAAESLSALLPHLDASSRRLLDRGFCRIITETPIDEFGTGDVSEGCYWLSASPRTTASILRHTEAIDVSLLLDLHRSLPPQGSPLEAGQMERGLQRMIDQHLAILRAAVSHGFGLLGHCG